MKYISVGLVLLVAACTQYRYDLPFETRPYENSRTLNESYDDAWRSVIDHLSATSFAIDNFEKDSGLITFSFSQSNISLYVNCGGLKQIGFNGSYADFLKHTAKGTLSGKVNISVREISENKTTVRLMLGMFLALFHRTTLTLKTPPNSFGLLIVAALMKLMASGANPLISLKIASWTQCRRTKTLPQLTTLWLKNLWVSWSTPET